MPNFLERLKSLGKSSARVFLPKKLEERFGVSKEQPFKIPVGEGLSTEQKVTAEETVRGITKEKKIEELKLLKPEDLKAQIKDIIRSNVQAGNLDKIKIKNDVKGLIKQRVNENILSRVVTPERRSILKITTGANVKENTKRIIFGLGALLGLAGKEIYQHIVHPKKAVGEDIEFAKKVATSPAYREELYNTLVKPVIEEYKEYRHPRTKLYEDPVDVLLDVGALLTFGATIAGKVGAQTAAASLGKASQLASLKNISSATKFIIRTLPGGEDIVKNLELAAETRKTLSVEQARFLSTRNKLFNEIDERVNKLSKQEIELLPAAAEGFAQPLPNVSKEFQEALGLIKSLAKDQERFGLEIGKLTPEIIDRRRFAPLAKFLEKEEKLQTGKFKNFEEFIKNYQQVFRGDTTTQIRLNRAGEIDLSVERSVAEQFARKTPKGVINEFYLDPKAKVLNVSKFDNATEKEILEYAKLDGRKSINENDIVDFAKDNKFDAIDFSGLDRKGIGGMAEVKVLNSDVLKTKSQLTDFYNQMVREELIKVGTPYEQLTGLALQSRISTVKKFFPDADPIYMRHFFEDTPKKFSSFFLNTTPVRSFKPGFLKKSYNKEGYIGQAGRITKPQLKDVLKRQSVENLKWQRNIQLIERLTTHPSVKVLKRGEKPLPGYMIFSPDGLIRFYRGSINLADEIKKKVDLGEDVWSVFENAVQAAFGKEIKFIGVTKARLYQAPEAMAKELLSQVKGTNPYLKLFYDKPLDAFRFTALALYFRWQVNNIIGNAMFSIISGDIFNPKAFYHHFQARKAGLLPDELFGGVHQVERNTSGKLGTAAEIPFVKSTVALHEALLNTKVVGQFMKAVEGIVKWTIFKPLIKIGNLSFKINQAVDDMFKGVGFINQSLKEARRGFLRRMFTTWDDTKNILEKGVKDAATVEKIVDNVHAWYYHGLNLTNFERRVMRRVIPFYSWMRWITLYSYRIATETPIRANIIRNFSRDFYLFTEQNKLPEYLKGSVPIGTDEDGTIYYLTTRGANPFSTINDFMSEGIAGAIVQGLAPLPKTILEQAQGEDAFLGRPFTEKEIHRAINGRLYKFDADLQKVVEVDSKVKPALLENLLRNYIPQYLLMETILTKGQERYTAEGLITILSDLYKDEGERRAVVEDIISKQSKQKQKPLLEIGKALGINIKEVTPEQRLNRQDALEKATSAILNKEIPILNPDFKKLLKQRILQDVVKGTPKDQIKDNLKIWIGSNVKELQKLKQ